MQNKYDILILGAGLGGLECAYILSKKGFKVCVLEKNKHIGGTLQNFKLGDTTFSSGMHYLGSLDEGQLLNKLFRYFNILDGLKLKRMDAEVFDRFSIGGKQIDYPMGWDNFREKMSTYFPGDASAIKKYVELIKSVAESQAIYNLETPEHYDIRRNRSLNQGIFPVVNGLTQNQDLQNALTALNFVYAGDRNNTSLYTHALITNYYIQSAYRLIGGSAQIADLLAKNIKEAGGEIVTEAEVDELIFKDKDLIGAGTKNYGQFFADKIISNIHPAVTLSLIPKGKIRKSFSSRISALPNTISVFGLHMRLKPSSIPYLNHNIHYYSNNDVWPVTSYKTDKWPAYFYMYFPAKEGGNEYADSVSIYSYMHFDEVRKWADKKDRGEDYKIWKNKKAEELIDLASQYLPNLKVSIIDWIAATPLTYKEYIGTPDGGMYGTLRDYHNPMASYVFPRTKIPNLYLTGQNINLHGMLGVSISALLTCGEIIDINDLITDVRNA